MLEGRFLKHWSQLKIPFPLTLLLSGGGDSVALFCLLRAHDIPFQCLHFVHDGDPDFALRSETFCAQLCSAHQVPLRVEAVRGRELCTQGDLSWEAACRSLRYRALQSLSGSFLTAHTLDDQAETVLLRLLDGSGLGGLAGIQVERADGVWRPLLPFSRAELRDYLLQQGVSWLDDPSNLDGNERARVRNRVLPTLLETWPHLMRTLGRTSQRLRDDEEFLRSLAGDWLERSTGAGGDNWLLEDFRQLPGPLLSRVLREIRRRLSPRAYRPRGSLVAEVQRIIERGRNDSWVPFPGGWAIGVLGERVWARPVLERVFESFDPLSPGTLPSYLQVSTEEFEGSRPWGVPVGSVVRSRQPGDEFRGKCLKKFLSGRGEPPWVRERWPLLVKDERVLGVWTLADPPLEPDSPVIWLRFSPARLRGL